MTFNTNNKVHSGKTPDGNITQVSSATFDTHDAIWMVTPWFALHARTHNFYISTFLAECRVHSLLVTAPCSLRTYIGRAQHCPFL